ncbi:MAG: D-alanyl-D-alanine carboxypeptidase/D-alanyl-D-alanine-endopeptidase [Ignavibacterium sp.]|nr:D-alanyl-D-alanine carboxypeptidase/D-alanyl-D-alanine-endopeptidase [Ignavibacterium sp.]HRN27264.1 D-alanyl-D-alanine carboxypeptidase/D-alanyl-D-alanine-endopeptidase [Ignavibacteriaceae bacterium]
MIKTGLFIFLFTVSNLFASSKEEIANKIRDIISNLPSNTISGVMIYNPLMQDTIFAVNESKPMTPASLTKLFTTSTSLNLMGGDHKLSTKLFSDDLNFKDGVINGNLYIKGFGNSTFTESDLEYLVNELVKRGIKIITGSVIGDDTYFDDIYTREDWIEGEGANVRLPPISALVLDRNRTTTRKKIRRRYRYISENVKDPSLFSANALYQKLNSFGIEVKGKTSKGVTPIKVYPLAEKSIQLKDLIALINKHSDNFLAECLFKTLGAESTKLQGNSFFSQQAILKFVKDNNIYWIGTEIVDGSGISRSDQATPLAINGVLEKMYFDLVHFDDFYNSLSIAGVDGTLRGRMMGTEAENNFRGKTGSLNGVSGLAGYLTTSDGDDLIVTIIFEFNKGGWGYYRDVQDRIVELLIDLKSNSPD